MSIVKVIEVISEGKSMENALENALKEAAKTVEGIKQLNVKHVECIVEKNKIALYRVNVHISFLVKSNR